MEAVIAIDDTEVPQLFRHTRRPAWGYAVLAGEMPGKRRYQFQDGRLRIINDGFYHLLEPVDEPLDIALKIAAELESQVATADRRRKALKDDPKLIPFEDQVRAFKHLYPGGFADEAYLADLRGVDAKRRLKKMRNPAIEAAQAALSEDVVRAALDTGDGSAVIAAAADVLSGTDMVTRSEIGPLEALSGDEALAFAIALHAAVWSDKRTELASTHFEAMRRAYPVGAKVTWPLLTTLPGLLRPDEFVVIKASVFREQAKWMAPGMQLPADASGPMYARLLKMAEGIRDRLRRAKMPANDFVDVYEFVNITMRPKGRKLIDELRG